jgi:hypothetical protein
MPTVGRPRTRTDRGMAAPVNQQAVASNVNFVVGGVTGAGILGGTQSAWSMHVDEWEYVPELRWPNNVWVFDQMRTDSQLAGLLTATMWGITQLRYVLDPNGARTGMVREISEDLNVPIMGEDSAPRRRMKKRFSHSHHVFQAMLAAIYGHMYFEQLGTIVDGKWRLRKLFPIMPQTIQKILTNTDDGGLIGIQQWGKQQLGIEPDIVGVDRLSGFIFQMEGQNWTGRSMLRDCYKDWLLKDRNLRVEAVNHERAGGLPIAEAPMGSTDDDVAALAAMMQQVRIGDQAGGAVPFGTKVTIAKGDGGDINNTIKRYDESMARRFLLQLMNLAQGGQHVGSYALGETFMDSFLVGQRVMAQWYCDTMTEHVIEDWVDWNYGADTELTPRLTWERSTEDSLGAETLAMLVQRGVITVDQELENAIRYKYMLPVKTEPRPEITPAGPTQPAINKQTAQSNESEQPGSGSGQEKVASPTSAAASAGSEGRVLPPPEDPAPVRASFLDRFKRRKPDVMAASAPALVTVPNVPILEAGVEYKISTGKTTFTPEDLVDAVMAANEDPGIPSPRLKLGHVDPRYNDDSIFDGSPSFGMAKNLRLSENGMTVYADYVGVPKWLAEIMPTAFPNRSIEGYWGVKSQAGGEWRFVLSACALLGVVWPGINQLEDLPQLASYYGETVPSGVQIVEASVPSTGGDPMGVIAASANLDDVRRAFYTQYVPENTDARWWWIRAVLTDPNELVVEDDESGQLYKLAFASDDQGAVSFQDAQPVRIDYIPDTRDAKKAAATFMLLLRWRSAARSPPAGQRGRTASFPQPHQEVRWILKEIRSAWACRRTRPTSRYRRSCWSRTRRSQARTRRYVRPVPLPMTRARRVAFARSARAWQSRRKTTRSPIRSRRSIRPRPVQCRLGWS